LLQRVDCASVSVNNQIVGKIDRGLLILLGITHTDRAETVRFVVEKCANLRIFEDDFGKMNRSLLDTGGQALVVSQFTLYGDTQKGRRPSFVNAAPPELAQNLYEQFVESLKNMGITTQTGIFGAHMHVELVNNGPVTIMVESPTDNSTTHMA
jgi:D-tyrosyl-tRNA(Tyr) deacylase